MAVASELAGQNSLQNSDLKLFQSRNLESPAFSSSYLKMQAAHLAACLDFMYESAQTISTWSSEKDSGHKSM